MRNIVSDEQLLNEIVFRTRNKNYGAYMLRASYHLTLLRALLAVIAATLLLTVVAAAFGADRKKAPFAGGQIRPKEFFIVVPFKPLEPESQKPQPKLSGPEKTKPVSPANSTRTYTLISEKAAITLPPDGGHSAKQITTDSNSSGKARISGTNSDSGTVREPAMYSAAQADSPAEFECDIRRYISRNLLYPPEAADEGISGTVRMRFVVLEDGTVGNVQLIAGVHPLLDGEAARVLKELPAFRKPAMLNGKPVRSYYDIPIKFSVR